MAAGTIVTAVLALVVLRYIINKINAKRLCARFHCKPVYHEIIDPTAGYLTTLVSAWQSAKDRGYLISSTGERFKRYNTQTFKAMHSGSVTIVTCDPENIKACVGSQFNEFDIGMRHEILYPLIGNGIFTSQGENWKQMRAMLRPQFVRDQIGDTPLFEKNAKLLFNRIDEVGGEPFNFEHVWGDYTLDVASEFLFGGSTHQLLRNSINKDKNQVFEGPDGSLFATNYQQVLNTMATRISLGNLYWLVDGPKFRNGIKLVHDFADYFVDMALQKTPEELEEEGNKRYTVLYELVKVTRDRNVLKDQMFSMLLAGRNTTSLTLTFFFLEISKHPKYFELIKQEVRGLYGEKDEARVEEITFESLKKTKMLKACIDETLRLHPIVPSNLRRAVKNTTLPRGGGPDGKDKILVQKGNNVVFSTYWNHHNREFWGEDVEQFRPERWFEDKIRGVGWNYIPFLGGPRICLGQQFSLTETAYVITRICQQYDNLVFCNNTYPPPLDLSSTLRPKEGCRVRLF